MQKINFVVGATASGKSAFAVDLAHKINAEIISADSVQIYREFNIGTAKITEEEMQGVPHYLIDILNPDEGFTVQDFKERAFLKIDEITSRGKNVIVCGGTGFYINSLIYELDELPRVDEKRREELELLEHDELIRHAEALGMKISRVHTENKRRLIRAVEVFEATGKQLGNFGDLERTRIEPIFYNLSPARPALYEKINLRTDIMLEKGLLEETESIVKRYGETPQALASIGYKQALLYLKGEMEYEEMREKIAQATRNYAKRQITWFKRYKDFETHIIGDS